MREGSGNLCSKTSLRNVLLIFGVPQKSLRNVLFGLVTRTSLGAKFFYFGDSKRSLRKVLFRFGEMALPQSPSRLCTTFLLVPCLVSEIREPFAAPSVPNGLQAPCFSSYQPVVHVDSETPPDCIYGPESGAL
jgi:hypothetical protein